jgi:hypothetical protein
MHTQHNNDSYLNQNTRERLVAGYSARIRELIDPGRDPYFINFMFDHIPGGRQAKMDVMVQEVTRVHHILTRHIVRRPEATAWRHLRPTIIGCHDLPVWKHKKEIGRGSVVNDGLHYNAIALAPMPARADMPIKVQYLLLGRQSRLMVPLDEHFRSQRRFYINKALARVHVTPITSSTMADYMLKTFKHGRVGPDSIQIWN